jgi:hypothetical protein
MLTLAAICALVLAGAGAVLAQARTGRRHGPHPQRHHRPRRLLSPSLQPALPGLRVSGRRMVAAGGREVRLRGVNRAGTEYVCIHRPEIFDGPSDSSSVAAIAAWHINLVRVTLNEDCWLGINGADPASSGRNYVNAIDAYVKLLHQYGIYVELSLAWAAPGTALATTQPTGPDADHAPEVWKSMAQTFRKDYGVILAPWGETSLGWACFLRGCDNQARYGVLRYGDRGCGPGCYHYKAAGMQQAVDIMRRAGYRGPIAIPCVDYGNMCGTLPDGSDYSHSTWLRSKPRDPDHQLLAEAHVYGNNVCNNTACLDSSMLPILRAGYPVLWGETGQSYFDMDCGTSRLSALIGWADEHGVGYAAWTWDVWGNCFSLIADYSGTPANANGAWVKGHYRMLGFR